MMNTLKKHLPFAGPEGTNELMKIATRFEDKTFSSAVNQTDYLRKLSMKMLTMETKAQDTESLTSLPGANNQTMEEGDLVNCVQEVFEEVNCV